MRVLTEILIILLSSIYLYASGSVIVDTTSLDFQNFGYTGTFGQQIVVDDHGDVHVCYNKTWCTEADTGWQVMYANVTSGTKIPIPSQEPYTDIQPGVVYMDGGHNGTPIYFYYGAGGCFWSWSLDMHLHAMARLNADNTQILPSGVQDDWSGAYYEVDLLPLVKPIEIEADNVNGVVHCLYAATSGSTVAYWNFDGTNFGKRYFILDASAGFGQSGKFVPEKYRRNGTKGADMAVSYDGSEVAIATLHPACNILLHKGYYGGELWEDDFYEGMTKGSVTALFDTTNSKFGTNIPNNDPKPYTEVQVSYDENKNLHVVYDAAYIDIYIDTCETLPWDWWLAKFGSAAGDTNGVFYDGSKHPKPQLRYWNSITKMHSLLAECEYPKSGETYKWFNYGLIDSGAGTWGKYINDGPIANFDFFINKDRRAGEPFMVCVWEEMQGGVTALHDSDNESSHTYYAYMKDIKLSAILDGSTWITPWNITCTPHRDEGEVSVYRDMFDNKIFLLYLEDDMPGSDLNLSCIDEYEDKFLKDWPLIDGHLSVPIRKESTEQVKIIYREVGPSVFIDDNSYNKNYPEKFELAQNYPNPFNSTTVISYQLKTASDVNLAVYDILGQQVKILINEKISAGPHKAGWDGTNETGESVSSGIYIYKFKTDFGGQARKMVLQK